MQNFNRSFWILQTWPWETEKDPLKTDKTLQKTLFIDWHSSDGVDKKIVSSPATQKLLTKLLEYRIYLHMHSSLVINSTQWREMISVGAFRILLENFLGDKYFMKILWK